MHGIVWYAFPVVQNFPIAKISGEFAGTQAMAGGFFAGFGEVDDCDDDATGNNSVFRGREQVALEVVAHDDEVPGRRRDGKFVFFEIGDEGVDGEMALGGAVAENLKRGRGAIDGGDLPGVVGEPERVTSGSGGEIESAAGRKIRGHRSEQRRGLGVEVRGGVSAAAIAVVPKGNVHRVMIQPQRTDCKRRVRSGGTGCEWRAIVRR